MTELKKIALSIIIVLLILFGLSKTYDIGLRHNANNKSAYVQKTRVDAEIVFHGPCEPLWMISPKALDLITGKKSYNLALSHSDFADNYLHLYFYLKNNKPPGYLFLYVTPESMDHKYNTFNTYRFAAFLGDPAVDSVVKECDPEYFRYSFIPFMKYAFYGNKVNFEAVQGLKHLVQNRTTPHFADGFEPPIQVKWDNHLEEFIELYPQGYHFNWDQTREKYLCSIIGLAKNKGIKIYLYESPVLKESIKYQPNREEILKRIDGIAEKYGIKYVRFDSMKIAESREYFMSPLNLNLEGARIFTDSLAHYINSIAE
jgi:hypothetical protein